MSYASLRTRLRTAALAALVVAPALAGCAADGSPVATSGSSVPSNATGASSALFHSSVNPSDAYGPVNLSIAH